MSRQRRNHVVTEARLTSLSYFGRTRNQRFPINKLTDVRVFDLQPQQASFMDEVCAGLALPKKRIPPKFFYDARGSKLFDEICETPEYYPTRTESAILSRHAVEIAGLAGPDSLLIEIGSGNSQKVRLLLDALKPAAYMPLDISREQLIRAAEEIARDYPWLDVAAVCVDYSQPSFTGVPRAEYYFNRIAFFPGSTIGNFEPHDAFRFLKRLRGLVYPANAGGVLIGVDLRKDAAVLNRAYNDAQGVTAAFNLNLLTRINRELGADFDLSGFEHDAFYNDTLGRVEMHLVSTVEQSVRIGGARFSFERGETIHTENSYKYTIRDFQALGKMAGFTALDVWTDPEHLFSVHYFSLRGRDFAR